MMKDINQAFAEVSDIFNHMEENLFNKIPKQFINMIEKNKDLSYKVNIDYSKSINDQNLLKGTRIILSLIYRDYICSSEKRKELLEEDNKEQKKHEEYLRQKYEVDFKKNNEKKRKIDETATQLIEVPKKNTLKKIIEKIKRTFLK